MNFVNSYFLLNGNHGIENYPVLRLKDEDSEIDFKIENYEGYGTFKWKKSYSLYYENYFDFLIKNSELLICFTSNISHVLKFTEVLKKITNVELNLLKINIPTDKCELNQTDSFQILSLEENIPISIRYVIKVPTQEWPCVINYYKNGLTKFSVTNNKEVIESVINLNLKLNKFTGV